jgi:hypothetical protein
VYCRYRSRYIVVNSCVREGTPNNTKGRGKKVNKRSRGKEKPKGGILYIRTLEEEQIKIFETEGEVTVRK